MFSEFSDDDDPIYLKVMPCDSTKYQIILLVCGVLGIFLVSINDADAQTYRTHSVSVSNNIYSLKIPLVGTLTISMHYSLDFEVSKPSFIEAGKMEKISLSPRSGVLTTTFFLNGDVIKTIQKDLPLGSTTTIPIPATFGFGEVFGRPTLVTALGVKGPASPSNYVRLDSMSTIDFPISVNNEIGNYNSVTVFFPMRVDLSIGGNINLILTNIPIPVDTIPIDVNSMITETIPLRKYYTTTTSLQVKDASRAGYIQVYPTVIASSGQSIQSSDISIYVDGKYTASVKANSWSSDIYTDSGRHNIEAIFSGMISSSNSAITYKASSQMQSFNVKSPPPTQTAQTSKPDLTCGSGTHEVNGQCVPDNGGGCLIATATFGTELAPEVQKLREIRDNTLLKTKSGTSFMTGFNEFYYSFSPTIADYERQNPLFKEAVKLTITPLLASISLLNYVDMDSETEVLTYGISLILLNVGMYFVAPAIVISKIRKLKI